MKTTARLGAVWQGYQKGLTAFVTAVSGGCRSLGGFTACRPKTTLLLSIVAALLCAVGWVRFHTESRSDVLWVPRDSSAKDDQQYVTDVFGTSAGYCQMIGTTAPNQAQFHNNVLQLATTWELFQVHEKVMAINVTAGGQAFDYNALCVKDTATEACTQAGYLDLWNGSFSTYIAAVSGSTSDPTAGNITALYAGVNKLRFPRGGSVSVLSIFGGIQVSDDPVAITASEAVSMPYILRKDAPTAAQDAWYSAFLDVMKAEAPRLQYAKIVYISGNSVNDEISRSVTKDFPLIGVAVIVFIVTAVLGLSKWDAVHTRSSLGLVGLLLAALAMLAGYGLAMAFGLPFTSLQETLPFVLLGVAVDVMFILVKSYEELEQDPDAGSLSLADIFERLLGGAGLSVLVTTLASMVAFALGTLVPLNSITWFSAYAVLSVLCICIMQLTGFVAVFYMNQRRIQAGRIDCLCCITRPDAAQCPSQSPVAYVPNPTTPPGAAIIQVHAAGSSEATRAMPSMPIPGGGPANRTSLSKRVMGSYYAPWLLWWPVKMFVIAAFAAYAIVSGIGITRLQTGQPVAQVAPDDSYLQPYFALTKATFDQQIGSTTNLYFRHTDPSAPAQQAKMHQAMNITLSNPTINATISAFQGNWLLQFTYFVQQTQGAAALDTAAGCFNPYQANPRVNDTTTVYSKLLPALPPLAGCVQQGRFYSLLSQWLAVPANAYYSGSFARSADGTITDSYFVAVHTAPRDDDGYPVEVWDDKESTTAQVNNELYASENEGSSQDVFMMYDGDYIFDQGDKVLPRLTGEYAGLAVAGVTAVLLVLLVHPVAALLMGGAVALVMLYLFGALYVLSLRFNQVSVVNLIMATGLAVDYSVYMAHKFMTTEAHSRDERVRLVLCEYGTAICMGALTALLGTIPLAFASSAILRTFFALLFSTILFSALVGMVLMPVLFSLIGPDALSKKKDEALPATVQVVPSTVATK